MIVLRAIGRFFKKIWDWIKQTAWIQPLLIVGIIFGIIFSIGPIVKAIGTAKEKREGTEYYFATHQVLMDGGKNSQAYKITDAINKTAYEGAETDTGVGTDKFFFVIAKTNCDYCKQFKGAFQTMENKMKEGKDKNFIAEDGKGFKLVSIFADEGVVDESGDFEETIFAQYLKDNAEFFKNVTDAIENRPFFTEGHIDEKYIEDFHEHNGEEMVTPTIMLVELNPTNQDIEAGVTELMFGIPTSPKYNIDGSYDLARYLMDCWNHTGDFALN